MNALKGCAHLAVVNLLSYAMKPCARLAFGCLIVATLALTPASLAQPQSVPRELAQRFVGAGTTIFIGELPPENRLGFDFPLPERTRVVGRVR